MLTARAWQFCLHNSWELFSILILLSSAGYCPLCLTELDISVYETGTCIFLILFNFVSSNGFCHLMTTLVTLLLTVSRHFGALLEKG